MFFIFAFNFFGTSKKDQALETIYIRMSWFFLLGGIIYLASAVITARPAINSTVLIAGIIALASSALFNGIKERVAQKDEFYTLGQVYMILKLAEVSFYIICGVFFEIFWIFLILLLPLFVTTIIKGTRYGIILLGYSIILHTTLATVMGKWPEYLKNDRIYLVIATYCILTMFTVLYSFMKKHVTETQIEKERLLAELGEKYDQLAAAQNEARIQYELLKETNVKLEEANKKLTGTVAEFYTLQQITQAISSIFDIKELLKFVNDIIIGVMGVNNSTIILHDVKKDRLRVHTTNVRNQKELAILNDNINSRILQEVLNSGKTILDNSVDHTRYSFIRGRNVNSLICIPLYTKTRKFGLVLVEHKHGNAFYEDNVRLLEIIGQQVSVAMENAELYQRMQDMATIDGLTGVYNRLYFHERLEKEFTEAQHGNYPLSLAIYDIDHFKKFNDTYGHLFGDKVLKYISNLVRSALRKNDILARFGGEEFIMLFPHTTCEEAVEKVEQLRAQIGKTPFRDNLVSAYVTVSFGVSSFPQCAATENELLKTADDALYDAKASGRNCVKCSRIIPNS